MDAIKECVDPKYHKYIQYGGAAGLGTNPTTMTMSMSGAVGVPPFPPKSYKVSEAFYFYWTRGANLTITSYKASVVRFEN
jgi:hypothetical protein